MSQIADNPVAIAAPGQTLYKALDAWSQSYLKKYTRHDSDKPTETGRKGYEAAQRIKDCHHDIPLDQLTFSVVETMADYWCARPKAKTMRARTKGEPISVETVKNMLGFLRRFLRWLHRSGQFDWRDTDRIIEDSGRHRVRTLMTPAERKAEAAGPPTWTLKQLITLYRYATNQQRLFMLLGLNGGFAQSEIVHLHNDEVFLDDSPPQIRYIRNKSGKPGGFALWPHTVQALRWKMQPTRQERHSKQPQANLALVTAQGKPFTRQRIANSWNDLLDRIQRKQPEFPRFSFKILRKTAAELIQSHGGGDSQVIAIMEARAKRTVHDDQADRYYQRRFDDVYRANMEVCRYLEPMFAAATDAFA